MKLRWQWVASMVPVLLGFALVAVLNAFKVIEIEFSPHDFDTFIVLSGLILTIILAFILISRETIRRIEIVGLERARTEANAERARFLRRLDHELKNPLMGIKMALTNLGNNTDPNAIQHLCSDIEMQVKRLNRLVTDLRKFADLGTQALEIQEVDPEKLLREIEIIAHDEIGASERHLRFEIPPSLPAIDGDYDLLIIALYNLISNALKFTRPGDHVTLQAQAEGEEVVIRVMDTGPGIAAADLPYIWDELYRAQATKNIPGSGIGLSLIKVIIERHQGQVSIQSEDGRGTAAIVRLPIHPLPTSKEAPMLTARAARPPVPPD